GRIDAQRRRWRSGADDPENLRLLAVDTGLEFGAVFIGVTARGHEVAFVTAVVVDVDGGTTRHRDGPLSRIEARVGIHTICRAVDARLATEDTGCGVAVQVE